MLPASCNRFKQPPFKNGIRQSKAFVNRSFRCPFLGKAFIKTDTAFVSLKQWFFGFVLFKQFLNKSLFTRPHLDFELHPTTFFL